MLTNDEITALIGPLGPSSVESANLPTPARRYKHSAMQPLAQVPDDGGMPSAIRQVQCHDLSATDIRYFEDEPPSTHKVVIGLGFPSPVKWCLAEIEGHHGAFMYGRMGFLVTARYLSSVPGSRGSERAAGKKEMAEDNSESTPASCKLS